MSALRITRIMVRAAAAALLLGPAAAQAIDGTDLPNRYNGFRVAEQVNATGYGNNVTVTEQGILVGSEMDQLYVSFDANNLWIGVVGNLPNKLGSGQSIVFLIDALTDDNPQTPPVPNTLLVPPDLQGIGGGHDALVNLGGTILEPDFYPETAFVVNRFGESTFADSWYLPDNFQDCAAAPPDCYDPNTTSIDPLNGLIYSVWMDTTNIVGVDDDESKDGAVQEGLAAGAVKGLRVRLDRSYYGLFGTDMKMMVVLMASDGTVSNQIFPRLSTADDPPAPDCLGFTPNFDETYEDPETMTTGLQGTQVLSVPMNVNTGTPSASAHDGSDIPAGFPANTLRDTQQIHTCFGDAVPGQITINTPGSELDQLFVRTDGDALEVAITGNLEGNGNRVYLFIDADPEAGENTLLDANGDPEDFFNRMIAWQGRTFDPGFAPEWAYVVNHSGGSFFIDQHDIVNNVKTYLGASAVDGASGTLEGGTAGGHEFVLNNSNDAGVVGIGQEGAPGDPRSALTGIEGRIPLSAIGVGLGGPGCTEIHVAVVLGNQDGAWLSNQFLPSLAPDSGNVNNDGDPNPRFNFGETAPELGGQPAFEGTQYASVTLQRKGDVFADPDCCINSDDLNAFVQVLLGLNNAPRAVYLADMNGNGVANGDDVQPFVEALLSQGPCP